MNSNEKYFKTNERGLVICTFLHAVIQLSASASVPSTTESIQTSLEPDQIFYQKTFEHFRQVFLAFPCSNKVVVNQLFDVYEEMPSSKYTSSRSMGELIRLAVVGSELNISPEIWRSARAYAKLFETSPVEATLNDMGKDLQLTSAQSERLQFLSSLDSTSEFDLYLYGFPLGVALGIPERDGTKILNENEDRSDIRSAAIELGALAEERCEQKYSNSGDYTFNGNTVRDFLQAFEHMD